MNLTEDEAADLRIAHDTGWLTLLAHVADLCDAYRAQGYVMGDLAHDGTLKAQAEAEVDDEEFCPICFAGTDSPQHFRDPRCGGAE